MIEQTNQANRGRPDSPFPFTRSGTMRKRKLIRKKVPSPVPVVNRKLTQEEIQNPAPVVKQKLTQEEIQNLVPAVIVFAVAAIGIPIWIFIRSTSVDADPEPKLPPSAEVGFGEAAGNVVSNWWENARKRNEKRLADRDAAREKYKKDHEAWEARQQQPAPLDATGEGGMAP